MSEWRPIEDEHFVHPCETAYNLGYWDACAGEPLFDDANPEYADGWRVAWESKEILASMPLPQPPIGDE